MITATYTHYAALHILFNMASLWGYGHMEAAVGQFEYIKLTFLLIVLSFIIQLIVYRLLIQFGRMEQYRHINAIGYSCVVFGWMSLASLMLPGGFPIFGFKIPLWIMPYVSLLITQVIVPRASFVGHLSGIFGSYVLYFLPVWLSTTAFIGSLVVFVVLIVYSFKLVNRRVSILSDRIVAMLPSLAWLQQITLFSRQNANTGINSIDTNQETVEDVELAMEQIVNPSTTQQQQQEQQYTQVVLEEPQEEPTQPLLNSQEQKT